MQHKSRFIVLVIVLSALALAIGPANAHAPEGPDVATCLPGAGYAPGCDVDQNGVIDIVDVQRTASRWNSSGVYTSGHDHFGEFWQSGSQTSVAGWGISNIESNNSSLAVTAEHNANKSVGLRTLVHRFEGLSLGVDSIATTISQGDARGVHGEAHTYSGGHAIGVYGSAQAFSGGHGFGVYGVADGDSGRGVIGTNIGGVGVEGRSAFGRGVYGWATAASGTTYGVHGQSDSTSGTGVYGEATAASGGAHGVRGESDSTSGAGVFGRANAATGGAYGVAGHSSSTSGRGVFGWATATSGTTYGVYGRSDSADGYSGYFLGRAHVTGALSKGGGSFKIDHPLDPANKYLYHSFVESPDMMNVYNGNVTTDDAGFATVVLPDYFEALNRDYRYQLTVIGQFAQAIVAEEVQGNQFRIQTDQPGIKVSWQVTGIRQDAWANANRIPVEQDKPDGERGLYLHPEALGQPKDLGLDYQRDAHFDELPEVEAPPAP